MTRQINEHGLAKLKQWEGLRTRAYKDNGGIWTIGYGHTAAAGEPRPAPKMTITEQQAEEILLKDLQQYEKALDQSVKVTLTDNQFAALVCFTFNVGIGAFKNSTLLKKLNKGQYDAIPSEMMKWVKCNGKQLQGLVNRRRAEGYLWMEGEFVSSKDVTPEVTKNNIALKPEVIAPIVTAATGLTGFTTGSGPFQWALAATMVIAAGVGIYFFVKRLKDTEA